MKCRLAANLSLLFPELPFPDRFGAAAKAGFDAVEILFPYEGDASAIAERLEGSGLPLVLMTAPPPNASGGPRGFAAAPGGEERFGADLRRALDRAERLGARTIHVMSGPGEGHEARAAFVGNLRSATEEAPGRRFAIEPLNRIDNPGYFLSDFDLALEVIDEVDAPNLGLQFDTYHAQIIAGDALAAWDRYGSRVVHVQIGDAPGRVEPGRGEIDFPGFFEKLRASGYDGYVGAEYNPQAEGERGLDWMREARGT